MRSTWITYKGIPIFYQDFSNHDFTSPQAVIEELNEVETVVLSQPLKSVLVLADFRQTDIGRDLLGFMLDSSRRTNPHVKKTAVIGAAGAKRTMAEILIRMTGQSISFFSAVEQAKDWLIS